MSSTGPCSTGWQKLYKQAEDELRDPRALALPDWDALVQLADALVAASHDEYRGRGDVVVLAACTAARIGEVSGCRVQDSGLTDKGTKGKRARQGPHHRGDPPSRRRPAHPVRRPRPRRPPVHRPARRTHLHHRPARRQPLGRRGHQTRLRTPAPPRPPAHRPDLVRRRTQGFRSTSYGASPTTAPQPA
ncbi:hypothetical protein ACFQ3Z_37995 [Streptomyces nogalater]